ncbi:MULTISPECIES: hypothetical protein [unclassified Prochlorococcus]|nr:MULTISPECIES: hypothetical protein [unclassified Prochlorococcus]KGG16128.1 hypothetical protein EV06_0838 [Prochlorococcus sp. MIT 0602]KGG17246.1 hypothetical protein EV07_0684 [Prochlorococcus sp. MIT 0603]
MIFFYDRLFVFALQANAVLDSKKVFQETNEGLDRLRFGMACFSNR